MNKIDIARFSQHQGPVQIDWSNPITRGLVAAYPLGNMISDATKNYKPLTSVGELATSQSTVGVTSSFNGTNAGIDLPSSDIVSGYPITVSMWVDWVSTSTNGQVFISLQGTNYHLVIAQKASGDGTLQFGTTAASGAMYYFGVSAVNAGWRHIIHTVYGPGSFEVFIDGKRATLTGTSGNYGEPAAGNSSIGYRKAGTSMRWAHTRIGQTLVYNRAFSDAEAFSLYQNPWQIFKPIQKQIFVPQPIAQEPYKVGDALTMANYRKAMQKVWTSQPQQAVGIDWSNPITRGLAFAATPSTGDVVGNRFPVLSGSSSIGVNASGKSYKSPSTQSPGAWTYAVTIPSSFDITVFAVFRSITANTAAAGVPTLHFNSAESVFFSSTGSQTLFSSTGNASTTITTLSAGKVYSLAGVKRVNSQEQYVDGIKATTNVTGNRSVGAITAVSIGRHGGANNIENCEYMAVMYFNRALSDAEIRSLSQNPWQIFKPLQNKAPITLPQYTVVTPELLADLIINMTTQSAAAGGIPAAISYDQLINMLAANALAQNPGLRLDTQINTLVTQAQASGIQLNLIASAVLSMSAANALATGIRTNLDTLINIQKGNAVASGGNILLDRAIQTVLSSATALGINSNIDKTININRANAQANGVTTLIDVVTNLVSGNATANSYGFGSGTVLNLQSVLSIASGITANIDKSINQNAGNSSATGTKLKLDKAINTLIANAQATGIKTNIDKSILTNTISAIGTGIHTILEYAISIAMNAGPASAIGTTLNIDRNILLAAGIANAANVNMSVVFTPLTYDPAYVIFETTEGLVVLDVNKAEVSLVGTSTLLTATAESRSIDLNVEKSTISSEGTQTLVSVSSESRTKIFDSNARPNTFDRN